jgi:8-oxo-dGTP pyrophosphatase MutT (NUDIX family)
MPPQPVNIWGMPQKNTIDQIAVALRGREARDLSGAYGGARAAVAIVLRGSGRDMDILFIRRAEHPDDPWSGQMAFPGGRQESGDEDLIATATRETHEEVGLSLAADGCLLGRLDELEAVARGGPVGLRITPYVFRIHGSFQQVPNAEVAEVIWAPAGPIGAGVCDTTYPFSVGQVMHHLPACAVGAHVVWGLTYRMLQDLLSRVNFGGMDQT